MEKFRDNEPATLESVWAGFRETDRLFKESSEKFDRELEKSRKEFDHRMKKFEETMGSWSNNHGFIAEEYFFNSFEKGKQNFFGENFNEIKKNLKGAETNDEFDIVLVNGKSVGLVEVKFKAHERDIPKIVKSANNFRLNFPKYKKHKIFLALATMAFYPELERECINKGIAVVKQIGDTVIIYDEHLRAF
jgi:hypothetical protein